MNNALKDLATSPTVPVFPLADGKGIVAMLYAPEYFRNDESAFAQALDSACFVHTSPDLGVRSSDCGGAMRYIRSLDGNDSLVCAKCKIKHDIPAGVTLVKELLN